MKLEISHSTANGGIFIFLRINFPHLTIISMEVLYVKKNIFSDNNDKKSSKGFYAALGISAVMIGSACYFAYDQGNDLNDKKRPEDIISVPEAAVDNKSTGIPKTTYYTLHTTPPIWTAPVTTERRVTETTPVIRVPAADIIPSVPKEPVTEPAEQPAKAEVPAPVSASKLDNAKPPLEDVSNILEPFSGTELVKNPTTGSWQTHNGTDIAGEVGTVVSAISSGEVKEIVNDPIWGITVTIDHHNGFVSKYCSLGSELTVQSGDTVASGQAIGVIGQTADIESNTPPHLHIEVKHNGAYVDPVSAFSQN